MIALVTGSSGFIGSHVVDRLVQQGVEVRCLLRAESASPRWPVAPHDGVQRSVVDFGSPWTITRNPMLDDVDVIIHAAGVTRARSAAEFHSGNVVPLASLLQALRERREQPRVVLVSSQAAAGPATSLQQPVRERDEPHPIEWYGESKLRAERTLSGAGVPWTIVRPASVYGPRDADFLAIFRTAVQGVLVYPGTRRSWLSIVHVRDCVEGILAAAATTAAAGRVLHVANAEPVSWSDVYAAVAGAVGRRSLELSVPGWMLRGVAPIAERLTWRGRPPLLTRQKARLAAPRYWALDTRATRDVLGVEPRTTLPAGMRETYLWYSENGWLQRRGAPDARLHPIKDRA